MREIPLTKGAVALVDDEDFEQVAGHRWHLHSQGYAARSISLKEGGGLAYMHRQILAPRAGRQVDHRDGNRLNNTRLNLRECTGSQNTANRKRSNRARYRFRGVFPSDNGTKWLSYGRANGLTHYLGTFDTEIEAALARDAWSVREHGEFARLNLPSAAPAAQRVSVQFP